MEPEVTIKSIAPTVFLRWCDDGLEQLVNVVLSSSGKASAVGLEVYVGSDARLTCDFGEVTSGESEHQVFVREEWAPSELTFVLKRGGTTLAQQALSWEKPRRWAVHVVQSSHHDVGYTDLVSHAVPEHGRWLDQVIDMAEGTRDYPDEAQFRIIVEQTWSIDHYLKNAPEARAARMVSLMQTGHVELTALFGNMTTELCGHETLVRTLYHSARIARRHGLQLVSAEHNDVPGFVWGLAEILADAGIRIFCPGLPLYYGWGGGGYPSFWDEEAIFGSKGQPGVFWWEAPSGKRILFWCNNQGCGGDCRGNLPGLADRLAALEGQGYPYDVLRWPVKGGARDNSPYIDAYAHTIRGWNETWAYPRLISSTNARFHADLVRKLPENLPVHRGDVPGQDYPVGASSTARATAINRRNHAALPAAETLAALAASCTDYAYQDARLFQGYEDVLWHDEHTWGHHFPCGPTSEAHELEKAHRAYRAAALAHDVESKALARIADAAQLGGEGIHLVVFNPLPRERTELVSAPLREIDNCGSEMVHIPPEEDPAGTGFLKPTLLGGRWHVSPPPEIVEGRFDLVDVATGETVPYEITELDSPLSPDPHAARRLGLGGGGKRYGFFEKPVGVMRDIRFMAEGVPPLGYRTYRLVPREDVAPAPVPTVASTETSLENDHYRVEVAPLTGAVVSIHDKALERELVDRDAPHVFGSILIRDPDGNVSPASCVEKPALVEGALQSSLRCRLAAPGHPVIEQTITLAAGDRRVQFAVSVVKDPTPMLEAYLAFPFALPEGRFLLDEPLHVADPGADRLPGAYSNRLTAQDWVKVSNADASVLWSSLDAPIVSLGRLWPSRVSPAHSCRAPDTLGDPPQTAEDLRGGAIYSLLFANNFGTNFSVSQTGTVLFRYAIASGPGELGIGSAADFGAAAQSPVSTIFTDRQGERPLPPSGSLLSIDNPIVRLLTLKKAEDGRGLILRLWNTSREDAVARVELPALEIARAVECNVLEQDSGNELRCEEHNLTVRLPAETLKTLRLLLGPSPR